MLRMGHLPNVRTHGSTETVNPVGSALSDLETDARKPVVPASVRVAVAVMNTIAKSDMERTGFILF